MDSAPLRIVVQRHVQRTALANASALSLARQESATVYTLAAHDRVFGAEPASSERIKEELQQNCTLRATGGLESILLLYVGARMLLHGKDCAMLGLMNGAEVEILAVALSAEDKFQHEHNPEMKHDQFKLCQSNNNESRVVPLKHMPEYLLVRALGAKWILPSDMLPADLPETFDRRGVFVLRPAVTPKLKCQLDGYRYDFQRTQLPLTAASCRIVYGVQGESFEATIADLKEPPSMDAHKYWLALYVKITRSKSLDGLLILRLPDRSALEAGPPETVREELQRLTELHGKTCERMRSSMADFFDGDLPQDLEKLFADETAL